MVLPPVAESLQLLAVQAAARTICNADKVLVARKDLNRRENPTPRSIAENVSWQGSAISLPQSKSGYSYLELVAKMDGVLMKFH